MAEPNGSWETETFEIRISKSLPSPRKAGLNAGRRNKSEIQMFKSSKPNGLGISDLEHLPVSLTPIVGLRLGELAGLEHPYIHVEPVFSTALLQSFYLWNDLIQDIPIVDNA